MMTTPDNTAVGAGSAASAWFSPPVGAGHANPGITLWGLKVVLDPARRLYDTFVKKTFLEHYRQ
jgi:hypothetical protein